MSRPYRVEITRAAQKDIKGLPDKIRRQVEANIDRLLWTLSRGERPQDIKPIIGEKGAYRIDSGEYRVLFYLYDDTQIVQVTRVKHRKDVYRNL